MVAAVSASELQVGQPQWYRVRVPTNDYNVQQSRSLVSQYYCLQEELARTGLGPQSQTALESCSHIVLSRILNFMRFNGSS
jgi:hypothetical protein